MNYLIATDLDGTLLDHHSYSHAPAAPALARCRELGIPVVFNTSKTVIESIRLRAALGNTHPFIVENGSAVYIPVGYFAARPQGCEDAGDFWVCRMGRSRAEILDLLVDANEQHRFRFTGFSQWDAEQIAEATGLPLDAAREAGRRDYSEPLLWQDDARHLDIFREALHERGLKMLQGGRFLHVLGDTDKGKAITWLKAEYEVSAGKVFTLLALGDSDNDVDMLAVADIAVVVRSPVRDAPTLDGHPRAMLTRGQGPLGWNEAVTQLLRADDT